jgi:glucose-1-phosphate cytidylyltransferase
MSDVTFDMSNNKMKVHQQNAEPCAVTLVDPAKIPKQVDA